MADEVWALMAALVFSWISYCFLKLVRWAVMKSFAGYCMRLNSFSIMEFGTDSWAEVRRMLSMLYEYIIALPD